MTDISALGSPSATSSSQSARIDRLFAKLDKNNDGQVSQAEFMALGQNLPGGQGGAGTSALTDLFKQIDADGNGSISKDELTSFEQKQVSTMRSAMLSLQELFGGQDLTGANGVHRGHHRHHGHGPVGQNGQAPASPSDPLSQLMSEIDTNGDGSISKDELGAFLQKSVSAGA